MREDYLTDCEMAEPADELCLVEGICGHFHAAHELHVLVHFKELVLLNLYFKGRCVAFVTTEGVFVKLDGEGLGMVSDDVLQLSGVGRGCDGTSH